MTKLTYEHLEEALNLFSRPKYGPDACMIQINTEPKGKPPFYVGLQWYEVAELAANTLHRDKVNSAKFEILKAEMKKYGLGHFYSQVFNGEVL